MGCFAVLKDHISTLLWEPKSDLVHSTPLCCTIAKSCYHPSLQESLNSLYSHLFTVCNIVCKSTWNIWLSKASTPKVFKVMHLSIAVCNVAPGAAMFVWLWHRIHHALLTQSRRQRKQNVRLEQVLWLFVYLFVYFPIYFLNCFLIDLQVTPCLHLWSWYSPEKI